MFSFGRSCSTCKKKPKPVVAEAIRSRSGDVEIELLNFPYEACECGRRVRWAFDPGTELSEQLFHREIPFAKSEGGTSLCVRCGSSLGETIPVDLTAEAVIEGFALITLNTRVAGFVCSECGQKQATPNSFDTGCRGPLSAGAAALVEAASTLGLRT